MSPRPRSLNQRKSQARARESRYASWQALLAIAEASRENLGLLSWLLERATQLHQWSIVCPRASPNRHLHAGLLARPAGPHPWYRDYQQLRPLYRPLPCELSISFGVTIARHPAVRLVVRCNRLA